MLFGSEAEVFGANVPCIMVTIKDVFALTVGLFELLLMFRSNLTQSACS